MTTTVKLSFTKEQIARLNTMNRRELRKLEKALMLLSNGATDIDPDQMLRTIAPPLTACAEDLVSARTYELALDLPLATYEALHAQAIQDYQAGLLNQPKPQPKPRRNGRRPSQAKRHSHPGPYDHPALAANEQPSLQCGEASNDNPSNVIPLVPLAGKVFHGGRSNSDTKWIGGETSFPGDYGK